MNELEVMFHKRQMTIKVHSVKVVEDRHYTTLISLRRTDRPRYWVFKCFNNGCDSKIAEINNLEVYAIDDFFDPANLNNSGIGRKCKGTLPDGLPCPYKYFFSVH